MKGTGLNYVLGLPGLFHHSHQALLGLAGQAQRSAPHSGCDQGRRPAGHRKCLGAKSHTVSVCPLVTGPTSPGACRTCRGEAPSPPPSSQPTLQGEVNLGGSCSLRPSQPGAPFWRPSARVSEVHGFPGESSIFSRATLASAPTLWPAWPGGSLCIRGLLSCPQLLSGLSLQSLFWAAGPQVSAPICLSPTFPSPNAACPSWGARCLPAACPPACSMPKLSACRLLERTELPSWPGPRPWSPGGAGSAGSLYLKDTGPARAPALASLAPALQARPEAHRVCWPEGSPP